LAARIAKNGQFWANLMLESIEKYKVDYSDQNNAFDLVKLHETVVPDSIYGYKAYQQGIV
jgi:hypothetical protein